MDHIGEDVITLGVHFIITVFRLKEGHEGSGDASRRCLNITIFAS
jgi:hypothetical protein